MQFQRDPNQPKSKLGKSEERCLHCGHEFKEHYNGDCPDQPDTALEEMANAIERAGYIVGDLLMSESCFDVQRCKDGRHFHITIEEIEE